MVLEAWHQLTRHDYFLNVSFSVSFWRVLMSGMLRFSGWKILFLSVRFRLIPYPGPNLSDSLQPELSHIGFVRIPYRFVCHHPKDLLVWAHPPWQFLDINNVRKSCILVFGSGSVVMLIKAVLDFRQKWASNSERFVVFWHLIPNY